MNGKECKEFNSLKYKTMIMTGHNIESVQTNNIDQQQLNNFLREEKKNNDKQTWAKLSKTEKIKKIHNYISENMIGVYKLNEKETQDLKQFINQLLERKRLLKINEISYNNDSGVIENIPILFFNTKNRKFTLNKNLEETSKKAKRKTKKIDK
jgi:hypothetical protein